jgi:FlaA1/EpsC-like NDP-sugar epimerase
MNSRLKGKTVLVTGAGGTIGSELCRLLEEREAAKVVLVGHSELPIYTLNKELRCDSVPVLADVRDAGRMFQIMQEYCPDYVFHAAAIKHVPLAEEFPCEAVLTNVVGTRHVALAAVYSGAQFVMISTDKAVYPSSIMGMTKRIAELFCFDLPTAKVVRFGNVWGSSGSVVPLFERQIAAGGPVTVTHPAMWRYFMSIPEAAALALEAAEDAGERLTVYSGDDSFVLPTYGHQNLYVLDMGKRNITDVAKELIGDKDIAIEYVGLRPGEKLDEDLVYVGERVSLHRHGYVCGHVGGRPGARRLIADLERLAMQGDPVLVRAFLEGVDYEPRD